MRSPLHTVHTPSARLVHSSLKVPEVHGGRDTPARRTQWAVNIRTPACLSTQHFFDSLVVDILRREGSREVGGDIGERTC